MNASALLLFPILFPMLAGVAAVLIKPLRESGKRQAYIMSVLLINLAAVLLLVLQPDMRWEAFSLTKELPILLKTDDLSRLFAVLASAIWILAGVYSFSYLRHEERKEQFFMFYLLSLGSLIGIAFAGNYMSLYLFYELLTLVSMPLVLHTRTKRAIAAALKYLFYSIAGASLSLVGFFFLLTYGGTVEFTPGGVLDAGLIAGHETALLVAAMLSIIGFGTKAGMFPMHSWLATAHPVAPAPASAVLSGVITKAGVIAVVRVVFYQFGADFIRGTWVQYTWTLLCLTTIFMGSMLAYKENQLKKRLAYSSVSQVSYILLGLSVLTLDGMTGALLHVVFHCVIKNALFLAVGAIIFQTHKINAKELHGIGKEMPAVMWCFTLASLALVGIPPASGFISKWYLAMGSLEAPIGALSWIGPVILLVSALLTAGYLLSISIQGFFPGAEFDYSTLEKKEPGRLMTAPLILLTAIAVGFGVFPGSLLRFLSGITSALF